MIIVTLPGGEDRGVRVWRTRVDFSVHLEPGCLDRPAYPYWAFDWTISYVLVAFETTDPKALCPRCWNPANRVALALLVTS